MQITVSDSARDREWHRATELADVEGWRLVARKDADWSEPVVVVTRTCLAVCRDGRTWRWHDGMLHALRASGARHPLVRLGRIKPGDRVLDATLGLGTDARFISEWTGETVVGLERSPVIARLTREGLEGVKANVKVVCGDALELMAAMPARAFDVVIADPMFPPRPEDSPKGTTLDAIRGVAIDAPLSMNWKVQACRVANRVVVVRDMRGSGFLEALGAESIFERRGRLARYGVWPADSAESKGQS